MLPTKEKSVKGKDSKQQKEDDGGLPQGETTPTARGSKKETNTAWGIGGRKRPQGVVERVVDEHRANREKKTVTKFRGGENAKGPKKDKKRG